MHYYPFHPGDYTLDTAHLEPLHDLAYRRLLDLYHTSEAPISLDVSGVARRIRLDDAIVESVLREFFKKATDGWHQARCDASITEYKNQVGHARRNGLKGGRPRKPKPNQSLTQASRLRKLTINQEDIASLSAVEKGCNGSDAGGPSVTLSAGDASAIPDTIANLTDDVLGQLERSGCPPAEVAKARTYKLKLKPSQMMPLQTPD